MAYPRRLEADGLTTLLLSASSGYIVTGFDLGDAATREVAENAPSADGTIDTTTYIGARAVMMSLALSPDVDSIEMMWSRLRAFTSPRVSPKLYFGFDDAATEMMLTLRRSQWSGQLTHSRSARVTMQWIAPLGIIESATLDTANAVAGGVNEGGRSYDLTFDRTYPASDPVGSLTVTNDGTMDAYPLLRLYGPCTGPRIKNETQNKTLEFDSTYVVAAGSFLEVDIRAKTIKLNGTTSAYSKLTFPASAWWTLSPGANQLRFFPVSFTTPSYAQIEWRDAYL